MDRPTLSKRLIVSTRGLGWVRHYFYEFLFSLDYHKLEPETCTIKRTDLIEKGKKSFIESKRIFFNRKRAFRKR